MLPNARAAEKTVISVVSAVWFPWFRPFRFGGFAGFGGFGRFVSVVSLVSVVSAVSFRSFRWFRRFRFGGFVSLFRVLVHALAVSCTKRGYILLPPLCCYHNIDWLPVSNTALCLTGVTGLEPDELLLVSEYVPLRVLFREELELWLPVEPL